MAGIEVGAKHRILFRCRRWRAHFSHDVDIALGNAAHIARRREISGRNANRYTGAAGFTRRSIGNGLAPAEAAMSEEIVELARPFADQMRKDFALLLTLEVGAGRRRRQVELRSVARVLGH